jgi:hypothetical protein
MIENSFSHRKTKKKKKTVKFFWNGNYCKIGENMKLKQGCNIKKWGDQFSKEIEKCPQMKWKASRLAT